MIHTRRTRATPRAARRATAGLAAVALASTSFALISPAFATDTVVAERFAGENRYATSAAVSAATYPTSDDVVIVSGATFPDGLSAAALAGQLSAPVMLVPLDGALPDEIAAEMTRLGATTATIVGGTAAVSTAMENLIAAEGLTVSRIAGADRYETANAVADAIITVGADNALATGFVASGENFPDALAASAPASADAHPIILTQKATLSAAAALALTDNNIKRVIIMGGANAVSLAVEISIEALGIEVLRIGGVNRYQTALDLADYITGDTDFTFDLDGVVVVSALDFPDALSAGPFADTRHQPIVFSGSGPTEEYVTDNNATIAIVNIIGGTSVIPQEREDALVEAATEEAGATAYTVSAGDEVMAPNGTRTYTVTGLTPGTRVWIALAVAAQVDDGTLALDAATYRLAEFDPGEPNTLNATIDQINDVDVAPGLAKEFTPTSSTLTFRVVGDGVTEEALVPVVYSDVDDYALTVGEVRLSVNLDGVPTEPAGIGGKLTFEAAAGVAPDEASSDSYPGVVGEVWPTGIEFDGAGMLLVTRATDDYNLGAATITKAQFDSIVSVGDAVEVTYVNGATADDKSTFTITDDLMFAPGDAAIGALTSEGNVVTLEYAFSPAVTVDGTIVSIQRATVVGGVAGSWTTMQTGTTSSLADQVFTETVMDGEYQYRIVLTGPDFSDNSVTVESDPLTVPAAVAPTLLRTYLTSNAPAVTDLSEGDVFKLVFDTAVTAPFPGASVTVGGSVLTYPAAPSEDAGAVTMSVNSAPESVDGASLAAGRVLTVTLLADPLAAVGLPAVVTATSGIANTEGAAIDVEDDLTQ